MDPIAALITTTITSLTSGPVVVRVTAMALCTGLRLLDAGWPLTMQPATFALIAMAVDALARAGSMPATP